MRRMQDRHTSHKVYVFLARGIHILGTWYTYTQYRASEVSEQTVRGPRTNNIKNSDKFWDNR